MRTESCETLVVEVGLNRVDAANEDVEASIELLLVYQERIIDVPLNLELVMGMSSRDTAAGTWASSPLPEVLTTPMGWVTGFSSTDVGG